MERLSTIRTYREEIGRVTLCGSTRFREEYELWNKRLTLAGFLVYSVSGFGHSGDEFTPEEKARLDQIHLAKIDASHAIVVINPGGYIGESTRNEINHALWANKPVYFTHEGRTVYQLRTGPDGPGSLRYRAFDYGTRPSRRCLVCANLNPCRNHGPVEQAAELARNDAAIAVSADNLAPLHVRCHAQKTSGEDRPRIDKARRQRKLTEPKVRKPGGFRAWRNFKGEIVRRGER